MKILVSLRSKLKSACKDRRSNFCLVIREYSVGGRDAFHGISTHPCFVRPPVFSPPCQCEEEGCKINSSDLAGSSNYRLGVLIIKWSSGTLYGSEKNNILTFVTRLLSAWKSNRKSFSIVLDFEMADTRPHSMGAEIELYWTQTLLTGSATRSCFKLLRVFPTLTIHRKSRFKTKQKFFSTFCSQKCKYLREKNLLGVRGTLKKPTRKHLFS